MRTSSPHGSPYFVNAFVDFACIGGISVATYLLFGALFGGQTEAEVLRWSVTLQWVINWPHFSATSHRLLGRSEHRRAFPLTSYVIPAVVSLGAVGCFLSPEIVAPAFIKIFLLWSPYHFSGQTLGLSLIYSRRAGFALAPHERMALSAFIFGTFFLSTLRGETGTGGLNYYGIDYPVLNLPSWMGNSGGIALGIVAAIAIVVIGKRCVHERRLPPFFLMLPALTQFVWFIPGASVGSFYVLVPMFHSLQYLLVAAAVHRREAGSGGAVWKEMGGWYAINLVGGVILFAGLPKLASFTGVGLPFATGVIIAAVQIHHFFVDGVIWKLRGATAAAVLEKDVTASRAAA